MWREEERKRAESCNQKIAKMHRFMRNSSKNRRCIGYHHWGCSNPYFKMEREPAVSERRNDKHTSGESQSVWYQENIGSTLLRCIINCSSLMMSFLPGPSRRVHPRLECQYCCNQGHNNSGILGESLTSSYWNLLNQLVIFIIFIIIII